ncbi:cecropin-C-like [Rhynchophorus ferrugineus]|uniref:cecropin-C-like n=1 Tax=Rhynchophorus ferrugineus TaxID=354439 RepID=UPI003FCE5201
MKFLPIFVLILLVVATIFGNAEAKPGWLKKQLKSVEKSVRRVRDRAQENLPLVAGYVGVAAQAGLVPGK